RHPLSLGSEPVSNGVTRTLHFFTRQRVELHEEEITADLLGRYKQTLDLRIPDARSFNGKVGLDAGCGEGRYTYTLTGYGAEVIGMDLGNAVDWAYKRNSSSPRAHIVQGSIFQPPFRQGVFDFVMSIGVIHHMTEPRRGFEALAPLLNEGGSIHIWVYGLEDMSFVYRMSHLTPLRTMTSHLPPQASYAVALPVAMALQAFVFGPAALAARVPGLGRHVHPQLREVAALPFPVKIAEVHDRVGAPVTHFLSEAELQDWYGVAGLRDVTIIKTPGGRGWSARGERLSETPAPAP
ncbi:MAG: class I SAM-dependent methyltransferase, partial [Chloroflexota bacterium]|nr:class I SAM-dependent methyltransferase [Chloroflexota bacterium]